MLKRGEDGLTAKQRRVLKYVIDCIEKDHRTPSIRQIGEKFGLRSTGSVRDVISALCKKGFLVKEDAISRGISLNPKLYKVQVVEKKKRG